MGDRSDNRKKMPAHMIKEDLKQNYASYFTTVFFCGYHVGPSATGFFLATGGFSCMVRFFLPVVRFFPLGFSP